MSWFVQEFEKYKNPSCIHKPLPNKNNRWPCSRRQKSTIESTSSLALHSFCRPSCSHSLTSNGINAFTKTALNRPMTKTKILQSKSLATITSKQESFVKDWEALLRAKVDVSIKKKAFKIDNLKIVKECEVI